MPTMELPKLCTPKDAKPAYRKAELGGYVSMEFDASVERHGFTWWHVKDGMGGGGDREDWVCDIPPLGSSVSVHDYNWNKGSFGVKLGKNFNEATLEALRRALGDARRERKQLVEKLVNCDKAILLLEASTKE